MLVYLGDDIDRDMPVNLFVAKTLPTLCRRGFGIDTLVGAPDSKVR